MSDLQEAKKHLSRDPVMKKLIHKHQLKEYWGGQPNYFLDLVEIVTGQQLSMKVADVIFKRLLNLVSQSSRRAAGEAGPPTTKDILDLSIDQLRSVGLSNSKSHYIQNIARAVKAGELDIANIDKFTDEEVFKQVTAIKGLGPWSAEMFLMFSLHRPDVFSIGDLGVRTAIAHHYHLDRNDTKKILELSESWRPYRTHACKYLWSYLDNT